jgi:hypothetical protein
MLGNKFHPEAESQIVEWVSPTAQKLLYFLQQGDIRKVERKQPGGQPILTVRGESLDVTSWNLWLSHQSYHEENLSRFRVDVEGVPPYSKPLSDWDIITLYRLITPARNGEGLITYKEAIQTYEAAVNKGPEVREGFKALVSSIGKDKGFIA